MSKIIGKISMGFDKTVQGMKDSSANFRVDGQVCSKEKEIHDLTVEIGRLTVMSLDKKKNLGPEILERYDAICAARAAIADAEKQRVNAKIVCPKCGKKTTAGMCYCGFCGAKISEDEIE